MMNSLKPLATAVLSICAFTLLPTENARALVVERIVAVVDAEIILLSDLEAALEQTMKMQPLPTGVEREPELEKRRLQVLDSLIAEKLLEKEIKDMRVDVTDSEITRAIEGTKAQYGLDDAGFDAALQQQGMTLEKYKVNIRKQLLKLKIIELKVKSKVQLRDQDVKSIAAKERATAQKNFKLRARHILFLVSSDGVADGQKEKAKAALARVSAGESFESVAREVSEGPSADQGGALGVFGRGEMLPAFEEAAFKAEVGSTIGPVRSQVGWHVILIEERVVDETSAAAGEEEALETVRNRLFEKELELAFARYVSELKQNTHIEIRTLTR